MPPPQTLYEVAVRLVGSLGTPLGVSVAPIVRGDEDKEL